MIIHNLKMIGVIALLLSACASEPVKQKPLISERFLENGNGTVTDNQTNLTWQRCSVGQAWTGEACVGEAAVYRWEDAMAKAKWGWRVPTLDELDTLIFCSSGQRRPSERINDRYVRATDGGCDGDTISPAINQLAFPNTPDGWFWSSTPSTIAVSTGFVWVVLSSHGGAVESFRSHTHHVRLVRGGW